MTRMEAEIVLLRGMVDQVRNQPYAFQCAFQGGPWSAANSVITYEGLTIDETSGGDRGLDITTGFFTVGQGYSGVWQISYSIASWQQSGENNQAWLYKNGAQIDESHYPTSYTGSEGGVWSLGSRSLYMRLQPGDTISLRTGAVKYI